MGNSGPKEVPTVRDTKSPEQMAVFIREVRELLRNLNSRLAEIERRLTALE